jgi:heme-degrading monooxygenase HmoA
MYARLTIMQVDTERIDEGIELYRDSVIPAAKSQKGFCEISLLVDRQKGKAISIALWESEEDAIANEESRYYQEQLVKGAQFFTKPPIREGYDVAIKA